MSAAQRRAERMRALVEAIASSQAERGFAPSMRELRDATGISSTSEVARWLDVCEREGLLVRVRRFARAITLTAEGRALAGTPLEEGPRPAPGGRADWR